MYKNIMLKISGESLAGDNEQGFDFDILNDLSNNIKKLADKKIKFLSFLVVVISFEVHLFQMVL
jgi:uridylate kinase